MPALQGTCETRTTQTKTAAHLVDERLLLGESALEAGAEVLGRLAVLLDLLVDPEELLAHLVQLRGELKAIVAEELVRAQERDPRLHERSGTVHAVSSPQGHRETQRLTLICPR